MASREQKPIPVDQLNIEQLRNLKKSIENVAWNQIFFLYFGLIFVLLFVNRK